MPPNGFKGNLFASKSKCPGLNCWYLESSLSLQVLEGLSQDTSNPIITLLSFLEKVILCFINQISMLVKIEKGCEDHHLSTVCNLLLSKYNLLIMIEQMGVRQPRSLTGYCTVWGLRVHASFAYARWHPRKRNMSMLPLNFCNTPVD